MNKPLTGRGVLLYLVAFFGVIIAVNAYFAYVAVGTFRGEDDLKPYQEGVEYNQTLARRAAQERLGWKAVFDVVRTAPAKVHVRVALTTRSGKPEDRAVLSGEFRHPADENRDRSVRLVETRAGEYEGDVTGVTPGAWDVIVTDAAKSAPFEATRRVWIP